MSVCGQSGPTEEDSASEEVGAPVREKTDIYKQKPASKVVRVLTVLAYLLSVSLVAILLSVYYTCVWKSPELPFSDTPEISARIGNLSDYEQSNQSEPLLNIIGGGNTTINGSIVHSTSNIKTNSTDADKPTTDLPQESTTLPNILPEFINGTSDDIGSFNITDIT